MAENLLLLNRADSAVMSHDYALAARLFTALLKENPDDRMLLERLGNVYIKSGDDQKALPVYEELNSLDPKNAKIMLSLGGIFRRVKKYDESIAILNKALSAGAQEVQVYYNLGFTYKLMGKYEEAIDCFETVVTLNPTDVLAYNHMGTIHELKKDHEAATLSYQMGLKIDANHPILHFNLAKTYENAGNVDAAVREYDAALRYKPGWRDAYVEYSRLLYRDGRLKEAEALCEQGLRLNEDSARLQSLLGDVYYAEDDYENAEKLYSGSLKADPKRKVALCGLAKSLEAQGKNQEALDVIQKAREFFPDDETLAKNSASILLSAKKIASASKEIRDLFDKNKDDVETLDLAGQYYIATDEDERAEKCYRKIEVNDPDYKSYLSHASSRYKQKENYEKAQEYIKKYIDETNPSDAKSYVSLARIQETLGNLTGALEAYNKALSRDPENRFARKSLKRLGTYSGEETQKDTFVPEIQEDLNAGFDETGSLEIDMGREENLAPEEVKEESIAEDDFDFETFGKSALLEDETEIDFDELAGGQEDDSEDDNSVNTSVFSDPEEKPPVAENFDEASEPLAPADFDSREPEPEKPIPAPKPRRNPEPEPLEEPETVEKPEPLEKPEPFQTDAPLEESEPPLEPESVSCEAAEENKSLEEGTLPDVPETETLAESGENSGVASSDGQELSESAQKELMEKMGQVAESAERAINAADKAWYAAQQAADNAQFMEEANKKLQEEAENARQKFADQKRELDEAAAEHQQALDEAIQKLSEAQEAASKLQPPSQKSDPEQTQELEPEQTSLPRFEPEQKSGPEEFLEDQTLDNDFDDIFEDMDCAPVTESEESDSDADFETEFSDDDEMFANTFDSAVKKANVVIPAIENILRTEHGERDYSKEIQMFKTLRSLSESLPETQRHAFMQSRTRLSLDYLISNLEGNPGLLKTSSALRKSGILTDTVAEEDVKTDYPLDELAKIVITDMKALSGFLEEDDLVIALNNLADSVLNSTTQ